MLDSMAEGMEPRLEDQLRSAAPFAASPQASRHARVCAVRELPLVKRRKAQLFSASSDLHGTKNELCTSTVSSAGLWSRERAVDGAAVARFFARGLPAFFANAFL